jgi:hypothetical protein
VRGNGLYRLEDLGPGFRCQRCRQDNQITSCAWTGPREPQWFYGLDEVVFQALAASAQVPVLALASLAQATRSFLYMNEAVVRAPGRNDLEVDLWAIADGQILIGEAKKSDKLLPAMRKPPVDDLVDQNSLHHHYQCVGAENLCHQAILVDHASGTVAPLDPGLIQVVTPSGSGRSGAAWFRVRCGRCLLQKSSYSRSTIIRCREFHTRVRGRSRPGQRARSPCPPVR